MSPLSSSPRLLALSRCLSEWMTFTSFGSVSHAFHLVTFPSCLFTWCPFTGANSVLLSVPVLCVLPALCQATVCQQPVTCSSKPTLLLILPAHISLSASRWRLSATLKVPLCGAKGDRVRRASELNPCQRLCLYDAVSSRLCYLACSFSVHASHPSCHLSTCPPERTMLTMKWDFNLSNLKGEG